MKIIYIVPLLIALVSYFIIKKYYTNEDGQSASRPCSTETIIDRAAAIKLFDKVKKSVVSGATLGADIGQPSYQEKLLFIYFGPMKEFEEDGQKKISFPWCIGVTWAWIMYDTDKRDARGMPQELCSMMDSIEKIKKDGVLAGKKLTAVTINDNAIEFDFEHIRLAVMMREEGEDIHLPACYLLTPDNEILKIFRDKIILERK